MLADILLPDTSLLHLDSYSMDRRTLYLRIAGTQPIPVNTGGSALCSAPHPASVGRETLLLRQP